MALRHSARAVSCFVALMLVALPILPQTASAHQDVREEIADLDGRIAAGASTVDALLRRADLHRLAGDFELAASDYDRATTLSPHDPGVALGRAALDLARGRAGACAAALDEFLIVHPDAPRALALRADARAALGRWVDAADDLGALARVATPTPDQVLQRSRWLDRPEIGLTDSALAVLDGGITSLGPVPALLLESMEIETRIGRFEDAAQRWQQYQDATLHRGAAATPSPMSIPPSPTPALATIPEGRPIYAKITRGPYLQRVSASAAVVRWRTSIPVDSRIVYGTSAAALDESVMDASRTTEHIVALGDLTAGTRYTYRVGSSTVRDEASPPATFHTAVPGGSGGTTRIWAIGDGGGANADGASVRDAFRHWTGSRDPDVWLMLGDNAYGDGTDAEYQSAVFDMYADLLRRVPVWPTRGNHDEVFAGPGNDYYDLFTLPSKGECGGVPSGTPAYYAFDQGDVHFVCLDSQGSDRSRGGAMMRWLEADLNANEKPWVIAYWHHPPYTKGSHDSDNVYDSEGKMTDMRQNALGILDSAGVDLVLTGHSHSYERSFLVRSHYGFSWTLTTDMEVDPMDGEVDGDGPYEKPSATRGPLQGIVYAVAGSSSELTPGPLNHPVMVSSLLTLGSLAIDVSRERLDAYFIDATGVVRDSFEILKGAGVAGRPVPRAFAGSAVTLDGIAPDPITGSGVIRYTLPRSGPMALRVLDTEGRHVCTLTERSGSAGPHELRWDARNASGARVHPGVYFAVLDAAGRRATRRFVVLR